MKRIFFSFFLFTMASVITWQFAVSPVTCWLVDEYFDQEIDQYYGTLVRGIYNMLLEDIEVLPRDQWAGYIKHRQPQFGYQLAIESMNSLALKEKDRDILNQGGTVVKKDGDLYYRCIGSSDQVLTMGPLPEFEMPMRVELLFWSMVVVNFALMALLWSMPFWLKLRRISVAAESFGKANFSARARISERSALFPLASSFNDMARKIQQLIASHKALTSAVSHELRTPISRIRFSMEMLEAAEDKAERDQNITEIRKDIDELETLVSELLIYARFDREVPCLELVELPVLSWMKNIARKVGKAFGHIRIQCYMPAPDQEYKILAEPRYMSRALGNLVQNAVKYAESRVEIRFEKTGRFNMIHVDDDGPGIPEADRRRIFQAFVRLDSSRSRDTGGYGLGLAIVKRIVSWHGGEVKVSKSLLGGTRFTIKWEAGEDRLQ
ncbi:MAG: ATP-binding protein [Desulfobacterales bacterium]|nr:ATP-binding protein [Desulfobacterales bacterium]